jgi:hypothetical protein
MGGASGSWDNASGPAADTSATTKPAADTSATDKSLRDYVAENGNARGYIQTLLKGANNITKADIDVKCGDFGWNEAYDKNASTGIATVDTSIDAGIGAGTLVGLLKGCHIKLHTQITLVNKPVDGVNDALAKADAASKAPKP